jgi:hypothetical protein
MCSLTRISEPTHSLLETSSDVRDDVATLLPVLQQAATQYSLAVTVHGRIVLTPISHSRMAQPLRLNKLSPSSSSSSVPSNLITS